MEGPSGANRIVCDISRREELRRVFEQHNIDQVVHLAAILPTVAQRDPVRATAVNINGSLNLLELSREFGVRRFVFGSSLSIYGSWPPDHVVSETDRAAPEDVYGAAKLYVEQMGTTFRESAGPEFVSLRIGRVVGPGARSTTSAWRSQIFELLRTNSPASIKLPYVGTEQLLLIHVEDAARALVSLVQADRTEHAIYNAPCESWVVTDLKQQIESLNPNLRIDLGEDYAQGNPRRLNFTRFQAEFAFAATPLAERLRTTAP